LLRPHFLFCGVLGAALAQGAAASEPELTIVVGGKMATYAPASLLAMPAATSITIPGDVAYKHGAWRSVGWWQLVLREDRVDGQAPAEPAAPPRLQ